MNALPESRRFGGAAIPGPPIASNPSGINHLPSTRFSLDDRVALPFRDSGCECASQHVQQLTCMTKPAHDPSRTRPKPQSNDLTGILWQSITAAESAESALQASSVGHAQQLVVPALSSSRVSRLGNNRAQLTCEGFPLHEPASIRLQRHRLSASPREGEVVSPVCSRDTKEGRRLVSSLS